MNWKISLFCISLFLMGNVWAQQNQKVLVAMNELQYNDKEEKQKISSVLGSIVDVLATGQSTQQQAHYKDAVRASIVKGISQGRRVIAIDGDGNFEEDDATPFFYVDGTVSNISTTTKTETSSDGKSSKTLYKGLIGVTLHIKDAANNKIVASPVFNVSELDVSWVETAEGAMDKTLVSLSNYVTDYFNKWLPVSGKVLDGEKFKKDKQKEVYIDLGESDGVYKGVHFTVYTTKTVAGKVANKQIGKIRIEDVQGEEISLCKVKSGGKEIKTALDNNEELLVKSID